MVASQPVAKKQNKTDSSFSSMPAAQQQQQWLEALYDPVADISTISQCISVDDLNGDGEYKLVVADLAKLRLRVFRGTGQDHSSDITELPTAMCSVYMDLHEPRVPGLAVGAAANVYIFKNFRPFFKIAIPPQQPNQSERDLWQAAQRGELAAAKLTSALADLQKSQQVRLSHQSLYFLSAPSDAKPELFEKMRTSTTSQLTQACVTCLAPLNKSNPDEKSISVLVIGTEDGRLLVVECEAFSIIASHRLPEGATPVSLLCSGLFDVAYTLYVATRKPLVCVVRKRDSDASHSAATTLQLSLPAAALGLVAGVAERQLFVACCDSALYEFAAAGTSSKFDARPEWRVPLPALPTCMAPLAYHARNVVICGVGLSDGSVVMYNGRHLVSRVQLSDAPTALRFGRYGREDNTMIVTTRSGALYVKILRRHANLDSAIATGPGGQGSKSTMASSNIVIPKVSKLYLEQADKERSGSNASVAYRQLQRDLAAFRLKTARTLVETLESSDLSTPISVDNEVPLRLSCKITGLGPVFKLSVTLENTSLTVSVFGIVAVVLYNEVLYSVRSPCLEAPPMLCPGLSYDLYTFVERVDQRPVAEAIRVVLFRKPALTSTNLAGLRPLLTAVINMPISEPTV